MKHRKQKITDEERLALPKRQLRALQRIAKQLKEIEMETPYDLLGKRIGQLNRDLRVIRQIYAVKIESYESKKKGGGRGVA